MDNKINVRTENLPEWVRNELKNNGSKPSDIAVYIGDNNPMRLQNEIDRLQNEVNSAKMMQWAIDRNKQLITYLKTSQQNIRDFATIYVNGHDGQSVKFYNAGQIQSAKASYNESWPNSTGIEQLLSSGLLYVLKPGEMILTHYYYGNRKHAYTLYVHPNDFNTLQLPPTIELTREEKIVLCATRSCKGSYAGDKNARFTEANRVTEISFTSYKETEKKLVEKGFLKKVGQGLGLTTEGRNVADKLNLYNLRSE